METLTLSQSVLEKSLSWEDLLRDMERFVELHTTSGNERTEKRIADTKVNLHRMKRIEKTIPLQNETVDLLNTVGIPQLDILCIGEAWCGDGSQIVGVVSKMCASTPKLKFHFLYRDDNPQIMDHFLTNGNRSVPIFAAIHHETGEVLGKWGPRPAELTKLVSEWKTQVDKETLGENIHKWYHNDKTLSTQKEFIEFLRSFQK